MKTKFWRDVERLAKKHKELCKANPWMKSRWELSKKISKAYPTHKKWKEDWDVHGYLGSYCARCGISDVEFQAGYESHKATLTCDEIFSKGKK